MITFTLPVVNRNCFLLSVMVWCMGYYLLAWVLFVMVAAVEYDEVKSLYSTYEEYYAERMQQERGKTTEDVTADSHILEEQIRLYTEENPESTPLTTDTWGDLQGKEGEGSYNYHETESADLDNDNSSPRTQYTEIETFWTEMIYKDWYHPTGIVMPEAIHYDIHSVSMYHSYYCYKQLEVELDLLTTDVTLPKKVMGCEVSYSNSSPSLGATHSIERQQSHITSYAQGYTHEVGYKREGLPMVSQPPIYKYVWI